MSLRSAPRPVAGPAAGTQTQTSTRPLESDSSERQVGVLRLRGERRPRPGVRWAENVVDNSNLNRKKSKVCCIYHKPRSVGESSSESSSSSSESGSDSETDNSTARMAGRGASRRKAQEDRRHECHGHDHEDESNLSDDDSRRDSTELPETGDNSHVNARTRRARRRSPNAYEKMKTYKRSSDKGLKEKEGGSG